MTFILPRIFLLASLVVLSGCMSLGEEIKDYTDRSLIYGWIDIEEVDANRIHDVVFYQARPKTKEPYWYTGVEKFEGGWLFYHFGFPKGAYKLDNASGQSCLLFLCSNTIYTYEFGKQGADVGAIVIEKPGVYYAGSYSFKDVDTGWFEAAKFDVSKAKNPPSQKAMLEFLLTEDVPLEHAVVAERIKKALR